MLEQEEMREHRDVAINDRGIKLSGELWVPKNAMGVVIMACESGVSDTLAERVAHGLEGERIATLKFDMLTSEEAKDPESRSDVDFLTERLSTATQWARRHPQTKDLPIGYFSTGTASVAAMQSAAEPDAGIRAIVSFMGDVALAQACAELIQVPTLLLTVKTDQRALRHNREVLAKLPDGEIEVHQSSDDPGVVRSTIEWFRTHLERSSTLQRVA